MNTNIKRVGCVRSLLCLVLTVLASVTSAFGVMQVTNNKLYDSNGSQFIIRGYNVLTLFWDATGWVSDTDASGDWSKTGDYTFSQVTQTGANTARIMWRKDNGHVALPAAALDCTIANCIKNNLVPMIMMYDVTGPASVASFNQEIDYLVSTDVANVLKKYESCLLVNLANEWEVPNSASGSGAPSDSDVRNAYGPAIQRMRTAGINCPLVIDAMYGYASEESMIENNAAYLKTQDTKNNLIFSIHCYDAAGTTKGSATRMQNVMDWMNTNSICFIWGEFNYVGSGGGNMDWSSLTTKANASGIGWLVWSWWDTTDSYSIAYNKQFRAWDNDNTWTKSVSINDSRSVQQNAIKTTSLTQQDAGVAVSNATVPANPVTIKFSGRNTVFTVDTSIDSTGMIQGASILQKAYTGATTQQWNLTKESSGFYKLVNVTSGKVIEVAGGSTANLASVQQGTDYGRNFQRWSITDAGSGNVHLEARHAALQPVTESDITTDGAPVESYAYSGNTFTIAHVGGGTTIAVTGVTVSPTSASIAVGGTQQLSATVAPSNATDQSTTWSSSNTAVATVTNRGLVTGIAAGSATITVACSSDTSKTAASSITVTSTNVPVTGVSVSPTSASIAVNGTQQLTATVSPSNANNSAVSWSSNNTSVATVSSSGLATGVAAGSATITVTTADGSKTATSALTVTSSGGGTATSSSITGSVADQSANVSLTSEGNLDWAMYGATSATSFDHKSSGGTKISNVTLNGTATQFTGNAYAMSWTDGTPTTSNTGTKNGLMFAANSANMTWNIPASSTYRTVKIYVAGYNSTGELNAYLGDYSATPYTVSVTAPTSGNMYKVYTLKYATTSWGNTLNLTWKQTSSTGNISLLAVTLSDGSSTIAVSGTTVSPTSASITVGATQQLTATVSPANASNSAVGWSSSNTAVATVSASGLVTGVAAGSATLTVTTSDGSKTATCAITVTSSMATSSSITATVADQSATVNLTSEGTSDWAKWGATSATSFDHKSSGGTKISNLTNYGTSSQYTNNSYAVSWTDGTPTASNTGTTKGEQAYAGSGSGFSFTVPASSTYRTVKVYVGGTNVTGQLTAQLGDYTVTYTSPTISSGTNASMYKVYTLTYADVGWGTAMTVYWKSTSAIGNVTIMAVTQQ